MTTLTRAVGVLLVVVGVVGFAIADERSPTALIPAALGVVLLVLGLLAAREQLHRHAIHGALVVALLGLVGTVPTALPLITGGDVERPLAAWASLLTGLACLIYIGFGVRSFVAARRTRVSGG